MMQHRHLVEDYIFTLRLMNLLMIRKSSGLKMKYPGKKVWQVRLGDFNSCPSEQEWIDADILLRILLIS